MIAILALLAGLLFPAFAAARGKARQTACLSHLRQLGQATLMYAQDYDDLFPHGCDAADKFTSGWEGTPFADEIHAMPLLPVVLEPYVKNRQLFRCPADHGFDFVGKYETIPLKAYPSAFDVFGLSYGYHIELTLNRATVSGVRLFDRAPPYTERGPSEILLLTDMVGHWHGGREHSTKRANVLVVDGHAFSADRDRMDRLWKQSFTRP